MKSIIVSGGNGFLGSHLVKKALSEKLEVTVVDDLSTSAKISVSREAIFVKEKIERFYTEEKFDFIAHLAARPSPEDYVDHPVDTMLSNSQGTKVMLDIARNSNGVFFFTSSSEVYGNSAVIPTPESYYGYVNPNGIRSCYDEGKRFSEALAMSFHREFNVDTRIQRPFNVYGPGIREDGAYGRVIPRFIDRTLRDEDIIIHGDGNQTRSFLYVDDWLGATWEFLTKRGLSGEVLNIGSEREMTIIELANLVIEMTDSRSKITFTEGRENDPRRRAADISRAEKILKWKAKIGIEEGLKRTIEWFRGRMK